MPSAAPTFPPALRDGDHLTSDEFLRCWDAMPDLSHAELIDGIVCTSSPVGNPHSRFHILIAGWLNAYEAQTPGCEGGAEGTWVMGPRDILQPDTSLRILPALGGQSRDEGIFTAGAPEFIAEIADSSKSRDLGSKLKLYERMGVSEYLVVISRLQELRWHYLHEGAYKLLTAAGNDHIFRSRRFPGLWLNAEALWQRSAARILATLHEGLASQEHQQFVAALGK